MLRIDIAENILDLDEGFEPEPYHCTEHYPTIGHGFRIDGTNRFDPLPKGLVMTKQESIEKLRKKILDIDKVLESNPDTSRAYGIANDVQKAVLISMCFQIGIYGLLKFKKFLGAMRRKDFKEAGFQCLNSLAARQTPNRWKRNAWMIERGELHSYYE